MLVSLSNPRPFISNHKSRFAEKCAVGLGINFTNPDRFSVEGATTGGANQGEARLLMSEDVRQTAEGGGWGGFMRQRKVGSVEE